MLCSWLRKMAETVSKKLLNRPLLYRSQQRCSNDLEDGLYRINENLTRTLGKEILTGLKDGPIHLPHHFLNY